MEQFQESVLQFSLSFWAGWVQADVQCSAADVSAALWASPKHHVRWVQLLYKQEILLAWV